MEEHREKRNVPEMIGEIFPEVMEQLVREYPPRKEDVSRTAGIPRAEIIKGMKEALRKRGI